MGVLVDAGSSNRTSPILILMLFIPIVRFTLIDLDELDIRISQPEKVNITYQV